MAKNNSVHFGISCQLLIQKLKSSNSGCTSDSGSNVICRCTKWVGRLITHIKTSVTIINHVVVPILTEFY